MSEKRSVMEWLAEAKAAMAENGEPSGKRWFFHPRIGEFYGTKAEFAEKVTERYEADTEGPCRERFRRKEAVQEAMP